MTDSIEDSAVWRCRRESAECEHERAEIEKLVAPHVVIGPCETKT